MERDAFTLLHGLESSWWYRGRAMVVKHMLARIRIPQNARVLDFGAGYGGMHRMLSRYGSVSAFEPDDEARTATATRGYARIFEDSDAALSQAFDIIGLFDVLEHIEDDGGFLKKAHNALSQEGKLVITVPAFPFLWSEHDVLHHHYRRYTPQALRSVLEANGYRVIAMSYWNMFLFPAAALLRLIGKSGEGSFALSPIINEALFTLVKIEAFLMRIISLPFGISLVVVAEQKD